MNMPVLRPPETEEFSSARIGPHVFNFVALGPSMGNAYKVSVQSDVAAAPKFTDIFEAAHLALGINPASIEDDIVYVRSNDSGHIPYFSENPYQSTPAHDAVALHPNPVRV